MTPASRGITLALGGLTLAGGALYYANSGGPVTSGATYAIDLAATPREVDEGDLVEFVATASPTGPDAASAGEVDVEYRWDFGDDSAGNAGLGLESISHRFVDGGPDFRPYPVRVQVGASSRETVVIVNNVAPQIRNVWHSRPVLEGEPIDFEASAVDPGIDDRLTYTWDFGDGGTATGQRVRHTFEADGIYTVRIAVEDGDDGQDETTISVIVGDGGVFTVSGDVSLPPTSIERLVLVGTSGNPLAATASGPCQLRIQMGSTDRTSPTMTLTATLDPGLGERGYPIGSTTEWDGTVLDEQGHPEVFFGDLGLADSQAYRMLRGQKVGGPFWSRGGSVDVAYFDGQHLELHFSSTLVENIPPTLGPRTAFVEGTLAVRVNRDVSLGGVLSGMTTGAMNLYRCDRDDAETFAIESRTPAAFARNIPTENPDVEITFSKPVDPGTVFGNFQLDYRLPDESNIREGWPVDGSWEVTPGDPYSVRFVPQAHLKDGVIYCVRVHAGKEGVRGRDGEVLPYTDPRDFPRAYQGACLLTRLWWESEDWALSTRVDIENLHADLYQASLAGGDTRLVPEKSTVTRVYTHWTADPTVHREAQVERFPARVSVLVNGSPAYPPKRVDVRRPDAFTPEDARNARNSLNFFGWRPGTYGGSVSVQPVIEFIDDSGSTIDRFEGAVERVGMWDRTEILSFDYYFLNVDACEPDEPQGCDWSEDVPRGWLERGRQLMQEGALFTTQNFPVIETQPRAMGQMWIDEPLLSGPCSTVSEGGTRYRCYRTGLSTETYAHQFVGERLYRAGLNSYADVIVGLVPPGFAIGWTGVMVGWSAPGKRIVLIDLDGANEGTVAHEFGHFFELDHCPENPMLDILCDDPRIQGFRMSPSGRSGLNKHDVEGNQEIPNPTPVLFPLMNWSQNPISAEFIANNQYQKLFEGIANAADGQARLEPPFVPWRHPFARLADLFRPVPLQAQASPAADGSLFVSGVVEHGQVVLHQVVHEPDRESTSGGGPAPVADADLTLELLGADGRQLAAIPFTADASRDPHGPTDDSATFLVDIPAPAGLTTVRVTGPGGLSATRARSAAPPVIEASATGEGGSRTLHWTTSDPDGDDVMVSVYVRADPTDGWHGIAVDTTRTDLALDAGRLPAGSRIEARLVAWDGFNTTSTTVALGSGAPLAIRTVTPGDGTTGVPRTLDVAAWVSTPLAIARPGRVVPLETGRFTLTDPNGDEVFADVAYNPTTGLLMLTPVTPLDAGVRYTATIADLEDVNGGRLASPVTWSFTTATPAATASP